jgi:hypothetical protein
VNQRALAPISVVLKPSLFKLELEGEHSDAALRLRKQSLSFHVVARTCGDGGQSSLGPLNEAPVIGSIGTLNEDLSDAEYWKIVPESTRTDRKPVQFALEFNGRAFSNALAELPRMPDKQNREPPVYLLFKALAQRERIYVEVRFGGVTRVLAIDPSIVVAIKG